MHLPPPELDTKDSALWRVGRNMHSLQSIEALLKLLLPTAQLSGTHQQISTQIKANTKAAKKASLGTLSDAFTKTVLTPTQSTAEPEVTSEVLFSFSTSIDAPPSVLKHMRSEWKALTKHRNFLAHSALTMYALESATECVALIELLDKHYEQAVALLDLLRQFERSRIVAANLFKQLHESGQLQKILTSPPSDA